MLLQHANASDGKKPSGVENLGFAAFSFPHRDDFSPLKQFKAGVPTYGIACNNLKLVIKKSDNTPVCVKPQNVQSLLVRGWGTLLSPYDHQTSNASSILRLDLLVTNDTIKSGQSITLEISLVNSLPKTVTIPEANDWPNNYLAISECSSFYPIGISILKGDYTKQNMTGITPLSLYPGYGCSTNPSLMPRYTFQPLSSKTTPVCEFTLPCPQLMIMKSQLSYDGYYDNNNQLHPFDTGRYTIVGGDEWGHIAIQHFTVINGTQENPEKISGFENDTGTVTFGNQIYYFEAPNYTHDAYFNPVQISFHDVVFTLFPSGFRGGLPTNGCGGQYYWTDVKFSDGTSELLHIFVGSPQCSDSKPPTYFSTHANPQAGLTFSDGKMKLLVSTNVVNSTAKGPGFKVGPDLLGPIPHQLVFFMKSNSTAKIFVEYASHEPNTGTMPSYSSVYVGKGGNYTPLTTSDVTINADPSSIPLIEGSDTVVVYNITAKEGVKGVYWIFLAQFCRVMPLVIDINSLTISPFDIPVQTGTIYCPAQVLDGKILGISEGTAEYKIGQPVK